MAAQRGGTDLQTCAADSIGLLWPGIMMLVRTKVGPSSIHGLGLFAVDHIRQGTPIWQFLAGFDHCFLPSEYAALPELARNHTRWFCFVSRDDGKVILSGDHACFINHSTAPNTGADSDCSPPVVTQALRDIAVGEELTCDYFAYDADAPWKLGLVSPDAPLGAAPEDSPVQSLTAEPDDTRRPIR